MILSRHEGGSGSPLAQNFCGAIEDLWKSMDFLRKAGSEILSGPMRSREQRRTTHQWPFGQTAQHRFDPTMPGDTTPGRRLSLSRPCDLKVGGVRDDGP